MQDNNNSELTPGNDPGSGNQDGKVDPVPQTVSTEIIDPSKLDPTQEIKTDPGKENQDSKKKHTGGSPRKEIDFNIFENLCKIFCTEEEIASIFEVHITTLNARLKEHYVDEETGKPLGFSEVYKRYAAYGLASVRRDQFRSSRKGNAFMQIWLGKQYLGQRDKIDAKVDQAKPVQIMVDSQETAEKLSSLVGKIMQEKTDTINAANNPQPAPPDQETPPPEEPVAPVQ